MNIECLIAHNDRIHNNSQRRASESKTFFEICVGEIFYSSNNRIVAQKYIQFKNLKRTIACTREWKIATEQEILFFFLLLIPIWECKRGHTGIIICVIHNFCTARSNQLSRLKFRIYISLLLTDYTTIQFHLWSELGIHEKLQFHFLPPKLLFWSIKKNYCSHFHMCNNNNGSPPLYK